VTNPLPWGRQPDVMPTPVQLGVRPRRILMRGLVARCPACGGRGLFHGWFSMAERCPTCDLLFERVEGHWIGSLGTNTTVIFGLMLVVLLTVSLVAYPDPVLWPLLIAEISIAVAGPILFFPSSRTLWTAIDLLMRPLRPGEIDPRFVRVDPRRDRPGSP
jgi:uncharacterized protein (DUF983 family)